MDDIMFKKLKELNKSKSIIITASLVIVLAIVIGTTYAWLSSKTTLLSNTFTYGDINISIIESDTNDEDGDSSTNSYVIMPGANITKDTKVIVDDNSHLMGAIGIAILSVAICIISMLYIDSTAKTAEKYIDQIQTSARRNKRNASYLY